MSCLGADCSVITELIEGRPEPLKFIAPPAIVVITGRHTMKLELKRIDPKAYNSGSYGIEQWRIYLDGRRIHNYLCPKVAMTKFLSLKREMGL